jgi:hypothetical protein
MRLLAGRQVAGDQRIVESGGCEGFLGQLLSSSNLAPLAMESRPAIIFSSMRMTVS